LVNAEIGSLLLNSDLAKVEVEGDHMIETAQLKVKDNEQVCAFNSALGNRMEVSKQLLLQFDDQKSSPRVKGTGRGILKSVRRRGAGQRRGRPKPKSQYQGTSG